MSKKKTSRIESIRKITTVDIPALMNGDQVDPNQYMVKRLELNMSVIQLLIGGDFTEAKDGKEWKIKFNHKLPSRSELAEIARIMEDFVANVETPFMAAVQRAASGATGNDDMSIPPQAALDPTARIGLPKIEKINAKKLKNYIFGYDGKPAMSRLMLNAADCLEIAVMGEDLRKKTNRNRMLIAGGIALLLTGGVAAAVCIHKKNKKDEARLDDLCECGDVSINDSDMPDVEIDADDAPVVSID